MDVQFGSVEAIGAAASYVDNAAAVMDYDAGGSFAQFGAKVGSLGNAGTKIRTVLAGVVKDAIAIAASGLLITLLAGSTLAAQAVTATTVTASAGLTVSAGGITVSSGSSAFQAVQATTIAANAGSALAIATFDNTDATNGGYIQLTRSGVTKGYIGSAAALFSGAIDDLGIRSGTNLILGAGSTEKVRISTAGVLMVGTTVQASATNGDMVLANGKYLRAVLSSGTDTGDVLVFDSNNIINIGPSGAYRIVIGPSPAGTANASAGNIMLGNTNAPVGNPAVGGFLWVQGGALKYRGSSGTVTTVAAA
jgi:hypothetical protein